MLLRKSCAVGIITSSILFCSSINSLLAQKLTELTPPSPKAYELGKYGQTPIGLFSGTVNTSIPIYTYRTKNLSVPISLNYSSNGVKVDELGSNVGLNWNLTTGGVITRIVRDLPDGDWVSCPVEKIRQPGGLNSEEALTYFYNAGNNPAFDSEADVFMFNFNGYSGKFIYNNDREIIMIPKQDIRIQPFANATQDGYQITTPDGVVYTFLEKEYTRNRAEGVPQAPASFYLSAWYLSSIKHPNGDEITFVYESEAYNYIASQQQSLTAIPNQLTCAGSPVSQAPVVGSVISYRLSVKGWRLKEIRSNVPEEGKVLVNSNTIHPELSDYLLVSSIQVVDKSGAEVERADLTYLTTANKRAFLQKVTMKDVNNNYVMEYNYPDNLPLRLSYAQDHWGYYNGVTGNTTIFPNLSDPKYAAPAEIASYGGGADKEIRQAEVVKGMLKRIYYPTKGYSDFIYEPNTYSGTTVVYPPPTSAYVSVTSESGQYGVESSQTFGPVSMDQNAKIDFGHSTTSCSSGFAAAIFTMEDQSNPGVTISSMTFSGPTSNNVSLQAGHSYLIKVKATRPCMSASAWITYYQSNPSTQQENKLTGGVRVQKVINNDGINGTQVTRYYYGKKESVDVSTGEKGLMPFYLNIQHNRSSCNNQDVDLITYDVSSNSLNALYNSLGTNTTGYNFVTVSEGGDAFENGGTEHEFILDNDAPAKCLQGERIPMAPWSNIGFANGKEKTSITFKKINNVITVLKKVSNTYVQDSRYHKETFAYVVQKKYASALNQSVSYTCTSTDAARKWVYYDCTKNHDITIGSETYHRDHNWGLSYFYSNIICVLPDAINVKRTVYDKCKDNVGVTFVSTFSTENLNITECKYNSDWEYLSSVVTTDYDLNGANPVITTKNFYYDNPVHLQLTRTETTTGGNVIKEKIYYPDDVTSTTSLPGGNLSPQELSIITVLNKDNQYRINTPVQTETYQDNSKRNTVRTTYQNYNTLTLPSIVKTLTGEASSTNVMRDRIYYNKYDAKGNILEAQQANDICTSYLWGMNKLFPVAMVKNARANEIFFDGFEEPGNWDAALTAYDATRSHTGKYSGRIDKPTAGELTSIGKDVRIPYIPSGSPVRYKYSAWVYSTGPSVDLFFFIRDTNCMLQNPPCYVSIAPHVTTTEINKWVYLEGEYDVPPNTVLLNVRIDNNGGGSVWFDDVRLHPSAAQMSSFTYQPLVGLTSETLPNQQVKKYEYDNYNRLKLIRNGDNAILQRNQYKFK